MSNQVALELKVHDNMTKALVGAQRQVQHFAGTVDKSTSNMARDFARVATSMVSVTAAVMGLKKVINEGISFNRFMQEQNTAFSVMMKSTDAAKAKIKELYDFAVNTPLTFKETASAAKQLMAYGFGADELVSSMRTLGTVAKATGHSLGDIAYVYGTLRSQGRAYSRDLMQFGMRGIPIYEELEKVMGVGGAQLKKMVEEGKVGFAEVETAFKNMTGEGGRFAGMLEKYMDTLSGKLSMLTDIFQQSAGAIASGITTQLTAGLDGLMTTLTDSQDTFREIGVYLGDITSAMLGMVKALIKLMPLLKWLVTAFFITKVLVIVGGLAQGLVAVGEGAFRAAFGVQALATSFVSGGFIAAISTAVAGLKLLLGQLMLFVANPAVLAIIALGAALGLIVAHLNKARAQREVDLASDPAQVLRNDLAKQVSTASSMASLGNGSLHERQANSKAAVDQLRGKTGWEELLKTAAKYDLSILQTGRILEHFGRLTEDASKRLADLSASTTALGKAEMERLAAVARNKEGDDWIRSQQWASTATALGVDPTKVSRGTGKEPVMTDFMAAFTASLPSLDVVKAMKDAGVSASIVDDETKAILGEQFDLVNSALKAVIERDFLNPDDMNPLLKKALAKMLSDLEAQIAGIGGSGGLEFTIGGKVDSVVPHIEMDMFFDRELMAKATEHMYDDIQLQREKDQIKALAMLNEQKITEEQYARAILAIDDAYYAEKDRLRMDDAQKELDAMEEIRQAQLENYQIMLRGDPTITEDFQAQAANQFSGGQYISGTVSAMQGSFSQNGLGAFIASTNKAATALTNFAEAAGQVTNELFSQILSKIGGIDIGKSIDNMSTGIANFINNLFGLEDATEDLQKAVAGLQEQVNSLRSDFDMLVGRIKEMIGLQVSSLKDLYEVGAISASAYESQVSAINTTYEDEMTRLYSLFGEEFRTLTDLVAKDATLEEMYAVLEQTAIALGVSTDALDAAQEQLKDTGTSAASDALTGATAGATIGGAIGGPIGAGIGAVVGGAAGWLGDKLGWWAEGTPEITKDHLAMVHKGETIIPKNFAEGLRAGDLTLSGSGGRSGGGDTYVTVVVEGSVMSEGDLATSVARELYKQRRTGVLTY